MSRSHQYVALHAYHGMQRPGGTGGQGSLGPKPPPWSKGGRSVGGTYLEEITADSPIAHWRMGDASSPFVDSINAYNAASTGTVLYEQTSLIASELTNRSGHYATTAYGTIAHNANLNITGAKSIELNIIPGSVTTRSAIMGKQVQSGNYEGWNLRLSQSSNDKLIYFNIRVAGGNEIAVRGTTEFVTGNTYNIILTYDGSTDASGVSIYINGVAETLATELDTLISHPTPTQTMQLAANGGNGLGWIGFMDEVVMYNTELSPVRALAHYAAI